MQVSAESFRMSPRSSFADRVRLELFQPKGRSESQDLSCNCKSVFIANARERNNLYILKLFRYPEIEPPSDDSKRICTNIFGHNVSFAAAMAMSNSSDVCAVKDFDCPSNCSCCKTSTSSCECAFRCPPTCKCYRSSAWAKVDLQCRHTSLEYIPTTFTSSSEGSKERALVTSMTFSDVGLLMLEGYRKRSSDLCPQGLRAVKHLTIEKSELHEIRGQPFDCMPNLQTLRITDNPLQVTRSILALTVTRLLVLRAYINTSQSVNIQLWYRKAITDNANVTNKLVQITIKHAQKL